MSCAFLFLCVNIEGDLDFYFNKLIRFLVLFIWVVALDYFAGNTRSNLQKGVKRLERSFEGYKLLEYFCFFIYFVIEELMSIILTWNFRCETVPLYFTFDFIMEEGGRNMKYHLWMWMWTWIISNHWVFARRWLFTWMNIRLQILS